jgi:hypothetical protein
MKRLLFAALIILLLVPRAAQALTSEEIKILLDSQKRFCEQLDSSFREQCKSLSWDSWEIFFRTKKSAIESLNTLNDMYIITLHQEREGSKR